MALAAAAVTLATTHARGAQAQTQPGSPPPSSASATPPAGGESPANERRRLLEEARRAQDAGDYSRALELAQRAGAMEMSPALRWFMARQLRGLRRYNEALSQADQCMRELSRDSGSARTLEGCRQFAGEIRTGYARLQFRFSRRLPNGARVRTNNVDVPQHLWGSEWYVDAGTVVIAIDLPDGRHIEQRVDTFPGRIADARVEVPAEGARPATPVTPVVPVATRGPGVGPWVLVGVGGAVTLSTIAFYLLRNGAYETSLNGCDPVEPFACPPENRGDYDTAVTWNAMTNVTLFGGPAIIAGGLLWFFLAPRRPVVDPAAQTATPPNAAAPSGAATPANSAPATPAAPARAAPILSVTPYGGPLGFGLRGVF